LVLNSNAENNREKPLGVYQGKLRSWMMTRNSNEVAPVLSFMIMLSIVVLSLPTIVFLYWCANSVNSYYDEEENNAIKTLMWFLRFSRMIIVFFAATLFVSRPKGSKKVSNCFYAYSCFNMTVVAIGVSLRSDLFPTRQLYNAWALVAGLAFIFPFFQESRKLLAELTKNEISEHFEFTISAIFSVSGPIVYLVAETLGCLASSDNPAECSSH